jgi:cellulose synthase operon protein C
MADASPAVLVDAVRAHADPRVVGESITLTMQAIAHEVDAGNTDGARRAYRAAAPLVALAEQKEMLGKVTPSAARLRAMMGEVEVHDGNVADAKKLFEAAVAEEPSGGILTALARIDRATGNLPSASDRLKQALAASDSAKDSALRGEILLMQSDLAREAGDMNTARSLLVDALKGLVKARTGTEGEGLARIERMMARVLDRFGAAKQARSALDRALQASPRDKDELSATLSIVVAQALVRNDIESARAGLHRGASSDLTDEDLVYLALWARATEKQMKVTTDGDADKVFASVADDGRWIGRLSAFGAGKIKADDLNKSAKTPAQKTEAAFYIALDRRAAGDVGGSQTLFKQALASGGVDLMEVGLARDILAGPKAYVTGPVPDVGAP